MKLQLIISLSILFNSALFSQQTSVKINKVSYELDSVSMNKPKMSQNLYHFSNNGSREIQYQIKSPKLVPYKASHVWGDIGSSMLTGITGIGFNSSKDVNWKVEGKIKSNDALPEWNISLFCEGDLQKDRERVRNDDGSWSVETERTEILYWDKDATGAIVERDDTIGFFLIIMNPRVNNLLKPWLADIFSQEEVKAQPASKSKWLMQFASFLNFDYGIIGIFRDKNFAMISNGTTHKTWIFTDNELYGIFRPDTDYLPAQKKSNRIMPYLLINTKISESDRPDLFRLAVMSRLIADALR